MVQGSATAPGELTFILQRPYRPGMSSAPSSPLNVYDYFLGERITEGAGDRRALLTDEGTWTYREIHEASGRTASLLRAMGVAPGDRVLMALPDGPGYAVTLFGILRMGGVVVMVNPHLSAEQIRYFYDYTEPAAALVDRTVAPAFADAAREAARSDGHVPELVETGSESFAERLAGHDADAPVHPTAPDDPAIMLFSGGTTGHPKGVLQPHRSFANTTELYGKGLLGMGRDDVTLSVPKLYFGYATGSNLFFPFSVGATSALFPERCTAQTLFEKIEAFRPTILVNVPTMVNHLVTHEDAADRDLSSLRLATSAGEALPVELHRRWDETFAVPLLDGLGTAEMWHIFVSNRVDDVRPGTLGRVVEGFRLRACDDEGRDVPPGEPGIMRVYGDSLALGYWKHEEKTREAFRDGGYVSGDMIAIDDDGYVTYAGRADDMLKVSGKWFSPRELENCLLEHAAVKEVAVVGARTSEGLVKPAAFVVADPSAARGQAEEGSSGRGSGGKGSMDSGGERSTDDDLTEALQAWARERLEAYKYPRTVVFLDTLPRTHLGKVDRGALARQAEATA